MYVHAHKRTQPSPREDVCIRKASLNKPMRKARIFTDTNKPTGLECIKTSTHAIEKAGRSAAQLHHHCQLRSRCEVKKTSHASQSQSGRAQGYGDLGTGTSGLHRSLDSATLAGIPQRPGSRAACNMHAPRAVTRATQPVTSSSQGISRVPP